ncbi:helix-turn-helix domain-containing protein [Roseomonas eburnea]|uniref:Helix-turn-helix domain-containing protein n=1 Tax=Neoroseomonas eburnea TaxID=1346889 RepID=A0A9X9XGG0_9PROT|nr:helix-turn-helix domain-containing protein [Neoroseomonas eburnea]MBR0682796.1 helix-turn-helix domain-containing protein [Neoroseomonas eburnea]
MRCVALLVVPPVTDLDVAICHGLLRVAQHFAAVPPEILVLTGTGAPVACSNGRMVTPTHDDPAAIAAPDVVLILSNLRSPRSALRRFRPWLAQVARQGALIGGADYGVQIMAVCGLLDGHVATTHWDIAEAMREEFPRTRFVETLYIRDRSRITCAGHLALVDMMMEVIGEICGDAVRRMVAVEMLAPARRDAETPQRIGAITDVHAGRDPRFLAAVALMQAHIETPLRLPAIAAQSGLSARQLHTVFLRESGQAPRDYYLELRLDRGRTLLRFSALGIQEVSLACGFASATAFARAFRARAGMSARRFRARYANRLAPALARGRRAE